MAPKALQPPQSMSILAKSPVFDNQDFESQKNSTTRAIWAREWMRLKSLLSLAENDTWRDRLWDLHTQYTRHYHTTVHIEEVLTLFRQIPSDSFDDADEACLLASIFFHDAVYDPTKGDNEEQSVKLWKECCRDLVVSSSIEQRVTDMILATKSHRLGDNHDAALSLFLDLDMAVLSKSPAAYLRYATLIRREYAHVPLQDYCTKRTEILTQFLQQPIYASSYFKDLEPRAQENLRAEIQLLVARTEFLERR